MTVAVWLVLPVVIASSCSYTSASATPSVAEPDLNSKHCSLVLLSDIRSARRSRG